MIRRALSRLTLAAVLAIAAMASTIAAHPDELRLKDGSKISGTIVGYENDSFKIETPYGFALVRKDKVAEIIPTAPKKDPAAKAKPEPLAPSSPAPAVVPVPAASETVTPPSVAPATPKPPAAQNSAAKQPVVAKAESAGTPPPPPAAPVVTPPAIRDESRGNLYVNYTYGFQMYKPPSWNLIPAARTALPDAVTALGTSDETTLLVIGRKAAKNSLEVQATAIEKTLADVYENYRRISERHINIAGAPGIERKARGTADGHDWSVTIVTFVKGSDLFTLLGMTWADSDLIQVQENVIAKTVNSLTFTATP